MLLMGSGGGEGGAVETGRGAVGVGGVAGD